MQQLIEENFKGRSPAETFARTKIDLVGKATKNEGSNDSKSVDSGQYSYTHAQEERIRAAGELLTGKFKSGDS